MGLFIVATPIGNLEDISLRAIRILKEADIIAAEDTRRAGLLLNKHGIGHKPIRSYFEHNEKKIVPELIDEINAGKTVALIVNAGTPSISDPGYPLISAAIKSGIKVTPIPGPSALITALCASGLPVHRFTYCGFPPRGDSKRRRMLEQLSTFDGTLIFYESPFRLIKLLTDAADILGERQAVVARELTKMHEEFARGTLKELLEDFGKRKAIKGEIVLLIEGQK